jgi:hypothetical protein
MPLSGLSAVSYPRPTQSRQNSLPSGSCMTMQAALMPSASNRRSRRAPSATRRVHSASSASARPSGGTPAAARRSRCNPVLRRLWLRHLLEEQPRPGAVGIDQRRAVVAVLDRDAPGVKRGGPRIEAGRWWRLHVVHRLGPEGRVRGGVGTVERHLKLSRHTPTLAHTTDNGHRSRPTRPPCPVVAERPLPAQWISRAAHRLSRRE